MSTTPSQSGSTVTLRDLQARKQAGEKFSCLTAYDATFAHVISAAGVDLLLVGDSLGMVLQGHDSTIPVSTDDIAYHVAGVRRGNQGALIMADMPFATYATPELALANATQLMQAGAHLVKLEGGKWLTEIITMMADQGIPVCGHLGLTPQAVNKLGGYRVQGRDQHQAEQMVDDAHAQVEAGADLLLLECVPTELARRISEEISVPVIGIGAGPYTDGQILVMHDLLNLTPGRRPKFVKNFMAEADTIADAFRAYDEAVKTGAFPGPEHGFS